MGSYGKWKPGERAWPVTECPWKDYGTDKARPVDGMAVQADRDEADINKIVARFLKSGQLPPNLRGEPFYGDVSFIGDYTESYMKVKAAQELFSQYPAEVRERFGNDVGEFVAFMDDESNLAEAEELGLVQKRPVLKPDVPDAPAPAGAPAGNTPA